MKDRDLPLEEVSVLIVWALRVEQVEKAFNDVARRILAIVEEGVPV